MNIKFPYADKNINENKRSFNTNPSIVRLFAYKFSARLTFFRLYRDRH